MGKLFTFLFLFLGAIRLFAQPTDLIFSEYLEGASNDKCIEIFNGTGASINLNGYSIRIYSNGSGTVSSTINLPSFSLSCGSTYVVCNSSAQASLLAIDDLSTGSLNYNGDDAVELFNGTSTIDLIGNIGCDPGSEWTGVGNGTTDNIIRRQSSYCSNPTDEAGTCPWTLFTAANWASTNNVTDFSDLGAFTMTCGSCSVNTITTSAVAGSPFSVTCITGSAVNVPFTSTGTFNGGNIYSAELSDATGSFASPTVIGTLTSTANSGTINATIPANTTSGTLYRIRVVSDNPAVIGTDNGTDLTINLTGACGITTGVIVGSPFTIDCNTWANVDVPFTTIGTYAAGNIFSAQISDASGSFASAVTIGTLSLSGTNPSGSIPSTIFAGLSTGSNYRIRVISSNPVQTGTDNGIDLTINNSGSPCYGPLVVNEISQGPSGNLEYFELLVVANNPCATLDLRNFILDDNNGDFSGGPVSGAGIASGHIRFTNDIQWANVPSGSLIVVYNEADKNTSIPADDPSDLIVPDKVYILPADHSLMEGCITRPTSSDATYSPCTYGIGVWNYISMANTADAAQVRYPNGAYSHGYSWGGAPMDGGPDNINVTTGSTSGENIYFDNTTNDDYSLVANFTTGTSPADETPGAGNSAANSAYIASLTCTALPVELLEFNVLKQEKVNLIYWKTITEVNTFKFELERSSDMLNFIKVYETPAAGNSSSLRFYSFADDQIMMGTVYYRLKIIDLNGEISYSNPRAISRYQNIDGPFVAGNQFILNGCIENNQLRIFDLSGKLIEQKVNLTDNYSLSHLQSGVYLIDFNCQQGSFRIKFSVIK